MRAIEIITKLRNRYIKKYFMAPENHKAHYISWLQDEYAELRMRQANGDNKSDEECTLPSPDESLFSVVFEERKE